jgi:hypothetical protein
VTACLIAILLLVPALAGAQDSRAEAIAAEQRSKATQLAPYQPHWAEQLLINLRKTVIEQPSGIYPYLHSVYSGGGFTLGAGTRRFTGDRTHWSVAGLYSVKRYALITTNVESPGHWKGRLDLHGFALWSDATQVAYHGVGIDTPAAQVAGFRRQQAAAGGGVTIQTYRHLRFTVAASYEDYAIEESTDGRPTVAAADPGAPGAGAAPSYLRSTLTAAYDWRPAADYARRGGLYQISRHHYGDKDGPYGFDRFDAEVVQHVPILRENWIVSLRGRLESTLGDDTEVPYFMLPSLGSGSTLRAYSSWRFRDRHAALFNAELRWVVNRLALDFAFFYDAGMVAPAYDAIALRSFVDNVGIGARFHGPGRTPLRIEFAHGHEGPRIVFAASAAF